MVKQINEIPSEMTTPFIPPIICTCFIDEEMLGNFDNPDALLNMFDYYVQGDFKSTQTQFPTEDIRLYFSPVNSDHNSPQPAMVGKSEFETREELYDLYDMYISQYARSIYHSSLDPENYFYEEDYE